MRTNFGASSVRNSVAAFSLTVLCLSAASCAEDSTGDTQAAGGIAATMGGGTSVAGGSSVGTSLGGGATVGGATGTSPTGACVAAATPAAAAMNPGMGCVSCHATQAPIITLGGNVYNSATGTTAVAGATVTITDAANAVTTLVTGTDGSFYTGKAIAYPAKVAVSKCPDTVPMVSTVTNGECNSCHGAAMRIHLP